MKTSQSKYCKCLYFSANSLARKVEKLAYQSWKKADLPPSHSYLLMLTLGDPGINPGALSNQLQLQPSTITRLIQKLEKKGLVTRMTRGKVTGVFPTKRAESMQALLMECSADFYESCSGRLGREESARLVATINQAADRL